MTSTLERLRQANPKLDLLHVEAPEFQRYGRLITGYDPTVIIDRAQALLPASSDVVYEPSVPALEAPCAFNTAMFRDVYGEMPMQVGWCYGKNTQMAALEYHKGAEIDVCLTDVILLVGHVQDVQFADRITYDTRRVAAFYAPAGSIVELPAWNLHYAPIHTTAGGSFATLVYLPKGTNEDLAQRPAPAGEAQLLFAVNKWLLAHPDVTDLVESGAYAGLVGDDIWVTTI